LTGWLNSERRGDRDEWVIEKTRVFTVRRSMFQAVGNDGYDVEEVIGEEEDVSV
jgi:hypothetical protein